jgi:hypothetical protein
MGDAWDRTPRDRALVTQFVIHHTDGTISRFTLGAHAPQLTAEDIDRIHKLWVDAVRVVGPSIHHRDVVVAALDSLEHEFQTGHERAVERLRRNVRT